MKVRVGTGNQKEINTYIREKEDHFEDSTKSVYERFLVSSNNKKKSVWRKLSPEIKIHQQNILKFPSRASCRACHSPPGAHSSPLLWHRTSPSPLLLRIETMRWECGINWRHYRTAGFLRKHVLNQKFRRRRKASSFNQMYTRQLSPCNFPAR